jgi:4a-hydroxytetrahydrobiopterin dehydratase
MDYSKTTYNLSIEAFYLLLLGIDRIKVISYVGGVYMNDLLSKKCIPCNIGAAPLNQEEIYDYLKKLKDGWQVMERKYIEKTYKFKDFIEALNFTNKVGELAEKEGHHPDIYLSWGKVVLKLWTHKIKGLHENDFILAAKIDNIV